MNKNDLQNVLDTDIFSCLVYVTPEMAKEWL